MELLSRLRQAVTSYKQKIAAKFDASAYKQKIKRKNAAFERKLNLGQASDTRSKLATKAFYRATQKYWQDTPAGERNEAILKGLGVETLEEAYTLFERENKKILDRIKSIGDVKDTLRNIFFRSKGEEESLGSPKIIEQVKFI